MLYKNWKIQMKNKCGVICQIMTPMICLLIIFGLQKLVDSLDFSKPDDAFQMAFSGEDGPFMKLSGLNSLMKGAQPSMGAGIMMAAQAASQELQGSEMLHMAQGISDSFDQAEVEITGERELLSRDVGGRPLRPADSSYRVIEAQKLMKDIKIPFNMIVPMNAPIKYKQLKDMLKSQFLLRSCYKMFKFGVSDPDSKTYLTETLKLESALGIRKTQCQMKKDGHKQPLVMVPNVELVDSVKGYDGISKSMFEEIAYLETVDIFGIEKEIMPSDGYMFFEEANAKKIKGVLSSNNIQFFAYHHDNYSNLAITTGFVRVYMNTETHLAMIDMLSNAMLEGRFQSQLRSRLQGSRADAAKDGKLAQEQIKQNIAKMFSSLSLKDILKFQKEKRGHSNNSNYNSKQDYKKEESSDSKSKKEKQKKWEKATWSDWIRAGADRLRQILSLSLTFPDRDYNKVILKNMFELLNVIFYPFAIGMALPIILTSLAMEKEEKIQDLLKINGMSIGKYYLSNLLFWFVFLSILELIFFVGGYFMLEDGFFHENSVLEVILFCIGWNLLQLSFSFFLLTFMSSAGGASALGYVLSTVITLYGVNLVTFIYPFPDSVPAVFNLIPQINQVRLIYYFLVRGSSKITDNEHRQFWFSMLYQLIDIIIYSGLTFVFSSPLVRRWWNRLHRKKSKVDPSSQVNFDQEGDLDIIQEEDGSFRYSKLEDNENRDSNTNSIINHVKSSLSETRESKVSLENQTIMHTSANSENLVVDELVREFDKKRDQSGRQVLEKFAVCVNGLVKQYDNKKIALRNLSIRIDKGSVYGLLGPNGAGKTTMISIITGFLKATEGRVFLFGQEKGKDPIDSKMALCPQFNIQWPNLSVEEHLTIFGMLRDMEGANLKKNVDKIMKQIDLVDKRHVYASKLSGGMRRRLSIGIALMGDTEIIFLDEPTTGLDPKRRRELWSIIKSIRGERSFVISTHLMEEAEYLCDKIGIITNGVMRATGTANYLKREFVNFLQVELTLVEGQKWTTELRERVCKALEGEMIYRFDNLAKIKVLKNKKYSEILNALDSCQDIIKAWSLKSGSLEDAFTAIEGKYRD